EGALTKIIAFIEVSGS
ncbi:hypothetical protein O9163_00015, partial [Treponema pallidum]